MKRQEKLKDNQIAELKEYLRTSESKKEAYRIQAILMVNRDMDMEIIKEMTGFSRSQIFSLRKKYLEKGISSIEDPARHNPKELLSKKDRDEIIETIKTKKPEDIGYHSDYWTTAMVGDWIKKKYKVKYKSKTSVYLIFRKASFSYHKPGRVYHKRNEQEVLEFRERTKKILNKALKEENTVALCEDEMVLSTQTTFQKMWLKKNEYPKIEVSNDKKARSVYGFLNIKTGVEHAFKKDWQNMFITVDVLKKLRRKYPKEKLLIFWDGAGWHRGSEVKKFIEKDSNIETVHFPRYSPEENPQEHVWKSGRVNVTNNGFIEDIDKATDDFVKYLNKTKFKYSLIGVSPISE